MNQVARMSCPFCDHSASEVVSFSRLFASPLPDNLRRCLSCGSQFQSPPPTPEQLAVEYEKYFIRRNSASAGGDENPKERYARLITQKLGAALDGARVLDLGAGEGFFSEYILKNSNAASLTAVDQLGVPRLEGDTRGRASIFRGSVEQFFESEDRQFDIILVLDLLEHLYSPGIVFQGLARLLAPGGIAIITCPRVPSVSAALMGPLWFQYKVEHITYPSFTGMEALARRHGIKLLEAKRNHKLLPIRYIVSVLANFGPSFTKKIFSLPLKIAQALPESISGKSILCPGGEMMIKATRE
jgi:SAM-dependent methyltransferase